MDKKVALITGVSGQDGPYIAKSFLTDEKILSRMQLTSTALFSAAAK